MPSTQKFDIQNNTQVRQQINGSASLFDTTNMVEEPVFSPTKAPFMDVEEIIQNKNSRTKLFDSEKLVLFIVICILVIFCIIQTFVNHQLLHDDLLASET